MLNRIINFNNAYIINYTNYTFIQIKKIIITMPIQHNPI